MTFDFHQFYNCFEYPGEEEYLRDWRPRGDSLLIEHQWVLERIQRISLVEKVRHILLVRSKLIDQLVSASSGWNGLNSICLCGRGHQGDETNGCICGKNTSSNNSISRLYNSSSSNRVVNSSSRSNLAALAAEKPLAQPTQQATTQIPHSASNSSSNLSEDFTPGTLQWTERETQLCARCIRLIQLRVPSKPLSTSNTIQQSIGLPAPTAAGFFSGHSPVTPKLLSLDQCLAASASSPNIAVSALEPTFQHPLEHSPRSRASSDSSGSPVDPERQMHPFGAFGQLANLRLAFVPEMEESRVSSVVSRQGPIYHLEAHGHGGRKFCKRWISVRRPYLFMYADEAQCDELDVINLANTELIVCEAQPTEHEELRQADNNGLPISKYFYLQNSFRHHLFQCINRKEVCDWLYAINPLLAGQIRSQQARIQSKR